MLPASTASGGRRIVVVVSRQSSLECKCLLSRALVCVGKVFFLCSRWLTVAQSISTLFQGVDGNHVFFRLPDVMHCYISLNYSNHFFCLSFMPLLLNCTHVCFRITLAHFFRQFVCVSMCVFMCVLLQIYTLKRATRQTNVDGKLDFPHKVDCVHYTACLYIKARRWLCVV